MSTSRLLTYEQIPLMQTLIEAVEPFLQEGEFIIKRGAFRWSGTNGRFLSNHYESNSIEHICDTYGHELIHNFHHFAVIRPSDFHRKTLEQPGLDT